MQYEDFMPLLKYLYAPVLIAPLTFNIAGYLEGFIKGKKINLAQHISSFMGLMLIPIIVFAITFMGIGIMKWLVFGGFQDSTYR